MIIPRALNDTIKDKLLNASKIVILYGPRQGDTGFCYAFFKAIAEQ